MATTALAASKALMSVHTAHAIAGVGIVPCSHPTTGCNQREQVLDQLRALRALPPHSQLAMNVARQQAAQALVGRLRDLPAAAPALSADLADKRADALALIAIAAGSR